MARVLVADDRSLMASAIASALRTHGFDANSSPAAPPVPGVIEGDRPCVVLVSVRPGTDPNEAPFTTAAFTSAGAQVIALADTDAPRVVLARCVEEGAVGIVYTSSSTTHLAEMISEVVDGREVLSYRDRYSLEDELRAQRAEFQKLRAPFAKLTPREAEVLGQMLAGQRAKEIAEELYISIPTVRSQIRAVLTKLGVNSQLEAVALAHSARWTGTDSFINSDDVTLDSTEHSAHAASNG